MLETPVATCQYSGCRKPIPQVGGRGHRPRLFCGDLCRQRHHREEELRKRRAAIAEIEAEASTRIVELERQVKDLQAEIATLKAKPGKRKKADEPLL